MKTIILSSIVLIWMLSFIILVIALTNLYPDSIFKDYRSSVGIAFVTIIGLLKLLYHSVNKKSNLSTSTQQN